jgi:hypothetical protein
MACDLKILTITPTPPTSPGGFGFVTVTYSTSSHTPAYVQAVNKVTGGLYANQFADTTDDKKGVLYGLPVGEYDVVVGLVEDFSCQAKGPFTMPAFTAVDTSLADAPRWEPVGGVLPNPVLLKVEATLLSAGVARAGLHVEVELWRPAAPTAFATFRATIREATQYIDAAPYLRAELQALQRYAPSLSTPLIDADASLRFTYRYRVVDRAGAEPWVKREGPRYAVLAALAGPTDTMAPYVADTTGKVASVFDDYEATQFVGYPLEASVLLPPASATPRWAELRYLDAWGKAVEIRSYALASTLPAGMLRIPLPHDPPLCASAVEVSVRDDNRAFPSTCGHVVPTPPASTSGLYSDPLYGTY